MSIMQISRLPSLVFSKRLSNSHNYSAAQCSCVPSVVGSKVSQERNDTSTLQIVSEDLSYVAPNFPNSFNFAAYVNRSDTLQKILQLNVNLSKIEKKPYIAEKLLKLDFEEDIKKHIFFLSDYIDEEAIGMLITKNPLLLYETLEDLKVRINYLCSKSFSNAQINRIIVSNPFWLNFSTKRIDKRLGYFQENFSLCGNEVRSLATKQPKIITYNLNHLKNNTFAIKEEMGFAENEVKDLILSKPKIWMLEQRALLRRFNYFHNVMKIPHSMLLLFPEVLLCRNFKVKQRHLFLKEIGRDRFDPKNENYVPIKALVEGTDLEFCKKYAKCNIDDLNTFLRTL